MNKIGRDIGFGCSICGTMPAINVEGTYWLCYDCIIEKTNQMDEKRTLFEIEWKKVIKAQKEDENMKINLPEGWSIAFPYIGFCKICHSPIISFYAVRSPGGKSYYHKKCVAKSPLFNKMGGQVNEN